MTHYIDSNYYIYVLNALLKNTLMDNMIMYIVCGITHIPQNHYSNLSCSRLPMSIRLYNMTVIHMCRRAVKHIFYSIPILFLLSMFLKLCPYSKEYILPQKKNINIITHVTVCCVLSDSHSL